MGSFPLSRNEQNSHHIDGGEYSLFQRITDSEKNHHFFNFPEPATKKLVNQKYFWYDRGVSIHRPIVRELRGVTTWHTCDKDHT